MRMGAAVAERVFALRFAIRAAMKVSWAMRPSVTMARSFGISAMRGVEEFAAGR